MLRKLLLIGVIITPFITTAQFTKEEGFVITHEGDTLHGEIRIKSESTNYKTCFFILDGEENVLHPNPTKRFSIAGYGFNGGTF